jgi:hypothetical protein
VRRRVYTDDELVEEIRGSAADPPEFEIRAVCSAYRAW